MAHFSEFPHQQGNPDGYQRTARRARNSEATHSPEALDVPTCHCVGIDIWPGLSGNKPGVQGDLCPSSGESRFLVFSLASCSRLLPARDVIISGQNCVSKLQRFFTLGDGCWLPIKTCCDLTLDRARNVTPSHDPLGLNPPNLLLLSHCVGLFGFHHWAPLPPLTKNSPCIACGYTSVVAFGTSTRSVPF